MFLKIFLNILLPTTIGSHVLVKGVWSRFDVLQCPCALRDIDGMIHYVYATCLPRSPLAIQIKLMVTSAPNMYPENGAGVSATTRRTRTILKIFSERFLTGGRMG